MCALAKSGETYISSRFREARKCARGDASRIARRRWQMCVMASVIARAALSTACVKYIL